MREIKLESGIEKIAVKNENDEIVCVLKINTADSQITSRFANLLDNVDALANEISKESARLKEKYNDVDGSNTEYIIEISKFRVGYISKLIEEIDAIFGEDTIKNAYHECYEINEDFMPDEDMLIEFIDSVMPIMGELFEMRFKRNTTKYNATKRGKHTKTKDELIAEAKK